MPYSNMFTITSTLITRQVSSRFKLKDCIITTIIITIIIKVKSVLALHTVAYPVHFPSALKLSR